MDELVKISDVIKICKSLYNSYGTTAFFNNLVFEDLLRTSTADKYIPQWISVKDGLPDDDEFVLVYTKDGVISVCSLVIANAFANLKNLKVWEDNDGYYVSDVTHWMPLPSTEGLNNDT